MSVLSFSQASGDLSRPRTTTTNPSFPASSRPCSALYYVGSISHKLTFLGTSVREFSHRVKRLLLCRAAKCGSRSSAASAVASGVRSRAAPAAEAAVLRGAAVASPKLFAVDRWSKKHLSLTFPVFPLFSQTPLLAVPDGSGARQRREGDQENQVLLSALPALSQVAAGLPATGRRPGGEELPPAQLGLPELP